MNEKENNEFALKKEHLDAIEKHGYPIAFAEKDGKIEAYYYSGLTHYNVDWMMQYTDEIERHNFDGNDEPSKSTVVFMIDLLFGVSFFGYNEIEIDTISKALDKIGLEYKPETLQSFVEDINAIPIVDLDFFNEKGLNFDEGMSILSIDENNIVLEDGDGILVLAIDERKNDDIPIIFCGEEDGDEDIIEEYGYDYYPHSDLEKIINKGMDVFVKIDGDYGLEFTSYDKEQTGTGLDERYKGYVSVFKKYFPDVSFTNILKMIKHKLY